MEPLSALKPPSTTEHTERLFTAVNQALNDVDRKLYRPIETLQERYDDILNAYSEVRERFGTDAAACGVSAWLDWSIANRAFSVIYDEIPNNRAQSLFETMERLGYPTMFNLVCTRMIWANALARAHDMHTACMVARQLVADIDTYRERFPTASISVPEGELLAFWRQFNV